MPISLKSKIQSLRDTLQLATRMYSELREVLVKTNHKDAVVVINGLQQIKAIYSEHDFPLDAFKDIFLEMVQASNAAVGYMTFEAGKKISANINGPKQLHPSNRYAARIGKVTVVVDEKAEFVSISVEGEPELDGLLTDIVIALNDALKSSLIAASKKLSEMAAS